MPEEGRVPGQRTDDEHERDTDGDASPVEVGQQAVGQGEAQPEEHDEGQEGLEPVDDVVHVPVVVVVPLDRAHGERAREDGEEAVAPDHLRRSVGEKQRREGEQRLTDLRQPQ